MPRVCTVCSHPERGAIDAVLVAGEPYRSIAKRFGASEQAMFRHKADHIPTILAQAQDAAEMAHGDSVLDELRRCAERLHLLFDACDAWLRDADDPQRYDIGPRSEEVTVTYTVTAGEGKFVRKKAKLSELLARVDGTFEVDRAETKYADPRDLVLKTYDRIQNQLELVAKLIGELNDQPQVNILIAPEWLTVRAALLGALTPFPEARRAVAERLLRMEGGNGHRG
ncbi:MAG TPA: hypothetical protein VFD58_31625 [Blastocatellia bacterium]|nr:hypothetical protein [Blastocatellia bacterium]